MIYAKRKSGDRILAIILSVMMIVAMFPVNAMQVFAIEDTGGILVNVTDGTNPINGARVAFDSLTPEWDYSVVKFANGGATRFLTEEIAPELAAANIETATVKITVSAYGHAAETKTIQVDAANLNQTVDFVLTPAYALTFVKTGNGVIKVDDQELTESTVTVMKGQNVAITFEPADANTTVASLKVNGEDVASVPTSFDANATIEVVFETKYAVNASGNVAAGGTVNSTATEVKAGEKATITATANDGYAIESILVNGDDKLISVDKNCTEKTFDITPTEDTDIKVNFVRVFSITIKHNTNGGVEVGGETVANEGTVSIYENAAGIVVKADPDEGYRVSQVTINTDAPINYTENDKVYNETLETKDYTIEFVFSPNVYNVTVGTIQNGTVTPSAATVEHNGEVTLTVVPAEGYEIAAVYVEGEEQAITDKTGCDITVSNITDDIDVAATFVKKTYKITFVGNNGKFTDVDGNDLPNNTMSVEHGSDAKFKYIPNEGYSATVSNGQDGLTAEAGVYTVKNITGALTITAATKDEKAPDVDLAVSDADEWKQEKVITFTTSDNSNGTVTVYVSSQEYADLAELKAAQLTPVASQKVTANGTYYVYAVDEAENFTKTNIAVEKIDRSAPVVSDLEKVNTGKFFNKQTTYTFIVTDTASGVKSVSYGSNQNGNNATVLTENGGKYQFTVSANGKYYIFVEDNAGNKFSSNIEVADVDTTKPQISDVVAGQVWNATSIEITFKAEDNNAVTSAHWSTTKLTEEEAVLNATKIEPVNGEYKFAATANGIYYVYAMDEAGNFTVDQIEVKHIDTTAPVVDTIAKNPPAEWHNNTIEISGTVSDNQTTGIQTGSTVAKVVYSTSSTYADNLPQAEYNNDNYSFVVPSSEFNGTYYVWAVDTVGRVSEVNSIQIKIDKTAPTNIAMSFVKETDQGFIKEIVNVLTFGLVFKDEVYISVQATDNRTNQDSGILKYQYQMVPTGGSLSESAWIDYVSSAEDVEIKLDLDEYENFTGKVYVRVIDVAGNTAEAVTDTAQGTTIVKDNANPAAPNFNLNGYQADSWTKEDVVITLSGADTSSGVKVYQYRIEYADTSKQNQGWLDMPLTTETQVQKAQHDGAAQFVKDKIVIDKDENATYFFRAVSNTGVESQEVSVIVKIQKTLPENATETIVTANGNNDWYVVQYPVITITEPTVSSVASPVTTYYKFWDTNKGETEPADAAKIKFTGDNAPVITEDGTYFIKVWTEDEAGNACALSDIIIDEIKVDITDPTNLTIEINDVSVVPEDANTLVFDTFYGETVTVKLNANCDISGLASLKYQKVPTAAQYNENGTWVDYPANGIVVEPNEKFIIYFCAEDLAGNKTIINSTGIVVDDKKPSGDVVDTAPDIDITPEDTNKTASGIYNGDVTVSVNVFDPKYNPKAGAGAADGYYSGLKEITYKVYTKDEPADPNMAISGTLYSNVPGNAVNLGNTTEAEGLVSAWTGKITIPAGKEAQQFNSNNVVVEITAIDNAGNSRTTVTTAGDIKIDVTAPTIHIEYNNNNVDSEKYYNNDRTATIIVTERNFNPSDFTVNITASSDGKVPTLSDWTPTVGTGNMDNTTYKATITFDTDGDYTFNVEVKDLAQWTCGNVANTTYDGALTYAEGTKNETAFTIDKTAPVVSVAYNNNSAANDKYFKDYRTATITIVEHNFPVEDIARVVFSQTAERGGTVPTVSWSHNGDTHTATFAYNKDGDYTFDVTMKDLAGNESAAANYGSSVAGKDFIIDTTYEDMISQSGVENGVAYGHDAEVIPNIKISDINLQEYTVTLTGVQRDKTIDLTNDVNALLNKGAETVTGIFDIFETKQDLDGIYTLKMTSKDKAGNEDSMEIVFTVNRFGSVYVFEDYLLNLVKDGGAFVQEVDSDLIITEFNADKLVADSLKIEITVDGKPLENVEYTVTPEINDTVSVGSSGWYQYKYTISKDNFAADGVYKISISSEDATGNTPENSNYEDKGMTFRVDSTQAEISSVVGLEEAIINAQEVTVKYTVFDTIGIKSIMVYVDGKPVNEITDFTADPNNYSGSFILAESSSAQKVRIVVEDMAGNITDTNAEDFAPAYEFNGSVTVSTNIFVRWYANKGLFWGSIGGVVVVAGALWFFLASKKKKKEEVAAK